MDNNHFCFSIIPSDQSNISLLHHHFSLPWIITIDILGGGNPLDLFIPLIALTLCFHLAGLYLLPVMLSYRSFLIRLHIISAEPVLTSVPGDLCEFNQFSVLIFLDKTYNFICLETFFFPFRISYFVFPSSFLFSLVSLHLSTHVPGLSPSATSVLSL